MKNLITKINFAIFALAATLMTACSRDAQTGVLAPLADVYIEMTHNFATLAETYKTAEATTDPAERERLADEIRVKNRQYEADRQALIEKANAIGKKCKEHGFKFTYHNHSHEFYKWPETGKTTMEMLVEGLDPETTSFVLDTFWVQTGGGDVIGWIKKLKGRIDIVHFKDMKISKPGWGSEQKMTEIGNGNLNWPAIIEACNEAGVKYYVVEQDRDFTYNCYDSFKRSAEFLSQFDF